MLHICFAPQTRRMLLSGGCLLALAVAAVGQTPSSDGHAPPKTPQPVALDAQRPGGELLMRMMKNFNRLEEDRFQPHRVFLTNKQSGYWPGDTEGRTVLGLTLLQQATGREAKYLETIMSLYPERMNERGYFGDIAPPDVADEQQLASHGWVLRALCEHYLMTRDPESLEMMRSVIKGLALPLRGMTETYVIDPGKREHGGSAIGTRRITDGNWILSTDTICVFIFLDGLVQAYEFVPSDELKSLIDELVDLFNRVDVRAIKAQLHATNCGLRALLRYYGMTGDPALLKRAADVFAAYFRHGMSETYEIYNWFGRPTHTEICGTVDGFQAAIQLWRYTGEREYLDAAQHIYYNGICAAMRANGGFGCNNCTGAHDCVHKVEVPEAWWCCTMRTGEGLSRVAQSAYHTLDDNLYVTFYADNEARFQFGDDKLVLRQSSAYPYRGVSKIKVVESDCTRELSLRLFNPSVAENFKVRLNGNPIETETEDGFLVFAHRPQKGDSIEIEFDLTTGRTAPVNEHTIEGVDTIRHGPLVLITPDLETPLPADAPVKYLGADEFECAGVRMRSVYANMTNADVKKDGPDHRVMFKRPTP